jgi:hypothetical protein
LRAISKPFMPATRESALIDDRTRVEIDSRAAWRRWLTKHHRQAESIWLVTWKKGDPSHVACAEIVEVFPKAGCVVTLVDRLVHEA